MNRYFVTSQASCASEVQLPAWRARHRRQLPRDDPTDRQVHRRVAEHVAVRSKLHPLPAQPLAADGRQRPLRQGHGAAPAGDLHARSHSRLHNVQAGVRGCGYQVPSHGPLMSMPYFQPAPICRGLVDQKLSLAWRLGFNAVRNK